jgi:uncharacterized membrane protein YfcA
MRIRWEGTTPARPPTFRSTLRVSWSSACYGAQILGPRNCPRASVRIGLGGRSFVAFGRYCRLAERRRGRRDSRTVHGWDPLWLALAGLGGGLSGSVAGLASLVSYPALLAAGLPAVSANVSNTVALVFSSIGSVSGSAPELAGQRVRTRRLAGVAVGGGAIGAVLLLLTPSAAFARIVPWLIFGASLAVLLPHTPKVTAVEGGAPRWELSIAVFAIAIYGGYFGAAAGVLLLAALMLMTGETLARSNAVKNLVLGLANGVAAVAFALFGPVDWIAVLPLAAGFFIGGRIGPAIVRRVSPTPLRVLIALSGVGLAVHLALDAYR